MVGGVDGEGEGVAGDGLDGEGSAEDGAGSGLGVGGAGGEGEAGAGLIGEAGPGAAVGGLVEAVVADGGEEEPADGFQTTAVAATPPELPPPGSGVRTVCEPSRTVAICQVRPESAE